MSNLTSIIDENRCKLPISLIEAKETLKKFIDENNIDLKGFEHFFSKVERMHKKEHENHKIILRNEGLIQKNIKNTIDTLSEIPKEKVFESCNSYNATDFLIEFCNGHCSTKEIFKKKLGELEEYLNDKNQPTCKAPTIDENELQLGFQHNIEEARQNICNTIDRNGYYTFRQELDYFEKKMQKYYQDEIKNIKKTIKKNEEDTKTKFNDIQCKMDQNKNSFNVLDQKISFIENKISNLTRNEGANENKEKIPINNNYKPKQQQHENAGENNIFSFEAFSMLLKSDEDKFQRKKARLEEKIKRENEKVDQLQKDMESRKKEEQKIEEEKKKKLLELEQRLQFSQGNQVDSARIAALQQERDEKNRPYDNQSNKPSKIPENKNIPGAKPINPADLKKELDNLKILIGSTINWDPLIFNKYSKNMAESISTIEAAITSLNIKKLKITLNLNQLDSSINKEEQKNLLTTLAKSKLASEQLEYKSIYVESNQYAFFPKDIIQMLQSILYLKEIELNFSTNNIGSNKIDDSTITEFVEVAKKMNGLEVVKLDFRNQNGGGNQITDKGAENLYNLFSQLKNLTEIRLDFWQNKVTKTGLEQIHKLKTINPKLKIQI